MLIDLCDDLSFGIDLAVPSDIKHHPFAFDDRLLANHTGPQSHHPHRHMGRFNLRSVSLKKSED
jgi:hypothetical protein